MTSDGGNTVLIVALGVGFLLGYLLSLITRPAIRRTPPRRRRSQARSRRHRGQVELTLASDGPAQVYIDLNRALARAGVAVNVKCPDKE